MTARDRSPRRSPRVRTLSVFAATAFLSHGVSSVAFGAGADVLRIKGDSAKALLGDGTNVVIGIVDSGVDDTNPLLAGTDSLGRPRMVAEANFVTTEPTNTGDDIYGHGTAVMGTIGLRDPSTLAIGTDTRYINARCLDSTNSFSGDPQVVNAAGFALANGANVLNVSLGYFNADTSGNTRLALMADYITYAQRIPVVISAGNAGNTTNHLPQGPADAFNTFALGNTTFTTVSQIATSSSYGPTTDGRTKPDLAAPGTSIVTANNKWETGSNFATWSGTSFAAPNTSAMLAAQIEFGQTYHFSIDPLVLKATLMNSADPVNRRDGSAWSQVKSVNAGGVTFVTAPIDRDSGAGQIDGLGLYEQYAPGNVAPTPSTAVDPIGWNLNNVTSAAPVTYNLGHVAQGAPLTATLTWFRKVGWTDANANGKIDDPDSFAATAAVSNLTLELYRDGLLYASSQSSVDTVEHLVFGNVPAGVYTLRVTSAASSSDDFALAWRTATRLGDFDSDGIVDASDIDLLFRTTAGNVPIARPRFDLTGDHAVSHTVGVAGSDIDALISQVLLTAYGDANLDHKVNFSDLLTIARDYGQSGPTIGWAAGDFTGDEAIGFNDLLTLARNYGFGTTGAAVTSPDGTAIGSVAFQSDWQLAQSLVPEPSLAAAAGAAVLLVGRRRRTTR